MVKQVTPELAGSYTCRAENVGGSVTCTASINITETIWEEAIELISPTFVKRLSPVRVMDGESVNLTCVVEGRPTPRVEWYHNDKPIKEGKEITIVQDMEGVCSLAITEVFPEDAGEYTCRAVNPVGEAVCTSSLVVEGMSFVANSHNLQTICLSSSVTVCITIVFNAAYEYVPDSEIASSIVATSLTTGSEEDLLSPKVRTAADNIELYLIQLDTSIKIYSISRKLQSLTLT